MTFIKLRELALSYNFPKPILDKINLNKLTVSLIGQNLWMWSSHFKHSDPDVNNDNLNSPSVRYLGFNIQVGF